MGRRAAIDVLEEKKTLSLIRIRTQDRPARSLVHYTDYRPQIMR